MFSNPNKGLEQNSRTEIALKNMLGKVDPHEAQSDSKVDMSMHHLNSNPPINNQINKGILIDMSDQQPFACQSTDISIYQ